MTTDAGRQPLVPGCLTPIRYAYILASPYSGTTLLSMLLDSHPRIVSIGELDNNIPNYLPYYCSCGQLIDACEFFIRVRELCARDGVDLDLENFRLRLGADLGRNLRRLLFGSALEWHWLEQTRDRLLGYVPSYRRHVERIFDHNCVIARASLDVSGKDLFLDASKSIARVAPLLRRPDVDLRLIHVVRDVRAVTWSALKHRSGLARIEDAARYWVRTHRAALRLGALVGAERYFRFRWEDFCSTPEPVLSRLCEFLGVETVNLLPRVNTETHHIIGNNIRLQPVVSIRSEESWRQAMAPSQRAAAERSAGELTRSFGYA